MNFFPVIILIIIVTVFTLSALYFGETLHRIGRDFAEKPDESLERIDNENTKP